MIKKLAVLVLLVGIASLAIGGVFAGQGIVRNNQLVAAMQEERVTLGIEGSDLAGEVIDSLGEALVAGDTIREHRRGIAESYDELLGEGRFDPADPEHLTYAQAMNLENYLYLAVTAFGLTQSVIASGVFMIIVGVAFGAVGIVLLRLTRNGG